jgi:hypothetical protein
MVARARGYGDTHLAIGPGGGNGNGNGNGNSAGIGGAGKGATVHTGACESHSADLRYIVRALKSGNVNQGYAQCHVDELRRMVEEGECSPERIQCRQQAPLRATPAVAGVVQAWTVQPVGDSFARELIDSSYPVVPVAGAVADVTWTVLNSSGRTGLVGVVAQTAGGGGNVAVGILSGGADAGKQNYVIPTGVIFTSSQQLVVQAVNNVAPDVTIRGNLTYDSIRMG